jgi:hypothetical protein
MRKLGIDWSRFRPQELFEESVVDPATARAAHKGT